MKAFYQDRDSAIDSFTIEPFATGSPIDPYPALIAFYDTLTAPPRVERVVAQSARDLIESLASRTYELSHSAGGRIPYSVIREVVENIIHAGFVEVVVSILDEGSTIRCADQGPGIRDKERVFLPGFTTATEPMKRVIKGVGSGLPIARECIGFSGGEIEVEDNLGTGTVVTVRMDPPSPVSTPAIDASAGNALPLALTLRQKQVLSLAMELGSLGPTLVSRELGVGLSTAYRDLEQLSGLGLITSDDTGKRALTEQGARYLDALLGR